jgi:uncharacterized alpha-E superfamily protein
MLSRVAESLYWMARYIERAESASRLAAVHFQAQLDGGQRGDDWGDVLRIAGDVEAFRAVSPDATERNALEFLLCHPANPDAVQTSLFRARENARGVREQIASEMWEHLNRLYFLARDGGIPIADEPYPFFRRVRDGSQAFEGITAATMTHGEAYEFIQLGRYVERATTTLRTLSVRYEEVRSIEDGTAAASLALMNLLKSCGAFEPFRRHHGSQLQAAAVAEYLLLSPHFPRAVLFCLDRCARAVATVAQPQARADGRLDPPARLLGKLRADLSYLDVAEVLGNGLSPLLEGLLRTVHRVGDEVTRTYFNTRVILPAADRGGAAPRQQQQQQQQS